MRAEWTGGDDTEEWESEAHAAWCEKWAPKCPLRHPQRSATLVGYREREPGRLQLRALIRVRTEGECDAIVEADDEAVRVRVVLCWPESEDHWNDRHYMDCPVHVYLEKPLNGRKVIWVDEEVELPLFVPDW
jgi:hypothetical protein